MDELRFVRRDDRSLIVANDAGEEFRFVVDDAVLSEMRHLGRREPSAAKVRPREIQALIRAGKSRSEVVALTGLDEADVERYEEPVLAERRYVLERAHAVPVRTDTHGDDDQRFGAVIAERLISLGSDTSEWSAWRDPERGWMVSLEFISHNVGHRAVWTFEHRKGVLSPINPDAVNLSKQGDVGDRLIPKLRAVDVEERPERFDSAAFDGDSSAAKPDAASDPTPHDGSDDGADDGARPADEAAADAPRLPSDANAEYERRREIDQRAISSDSAPADLSQTADLLDALRKRRGERDQGKRASGLRPQQLDPEALGASTGNRGAASEDAPSDGPDPDPTQPAAQPAGERSASPRSIWGNAGVSSALPPSSPPRGTGAPADQRRENPTPAVSEPGTDPGSSEAERPAKKGRASIPSWDDILFGTRSDEDPVK